MLHEARFLQALKDSGVSRVAIIDDVFDPPMADETTSGRIVDYLESEPFKALMVDLGLEEAARQGAVDALTQAQFSDDGLVTFLGALYQRYLKTDDPRFDPDGVFAADKGLNLTNLKPVIRLLGKAADIEVNWIGAVEGEIEGLDAETHLIFVDYYLDGGLDAVAEGSSKQRKSAREMALARIRALIERQQGASPSVVLMSSHKVRPEADKFRAEIGAGHLDVFASRFSFFEKTQLQVNAQGEVTFDAEAADALLDIVQSYKFSRALNTGLEQWLGGAVSAIKALRGDISKLNLKELAYLVRFRLDAEGQDLLSYLEWFFGECLLDQIAKTTDQTADVNLTEALSGKGANRVEGALDGPTPHIADLYHRVRIEGPRAARPRIHRLGDLYLSKDSKPHRVFAVLTPDCDLIERGPKAKRRADRALTVSGKLLGFDAPDTTVSDFVMIKGQPRNIAWDKKSVLTREFSGLPDDGEKDSVEYIGALRPIYAQELQRNVLNDLARVGVSVAPALAMAASATVSIKLKGGKTQVLEGLNNTKRSSCYFIPARGPEDGGRAVFRRQFVTELLVALRKLNSDDLTAPAKGEWAKLEKGDAYAKLEMLSQGGVVLEDTAGFGICVTGKSTFKPNDACWCWITVSMAD